MMGSVDVSGAPELLFRNLMLLDAATKAAHALSQAGIPGVLYKGVALFDGFIPLDARACSDADFLIPPHTHRHARRVLKDAGFSVHEDASVRRRWHPAGAVVAPNGCAVDLHEALAQPGRFTPPSTVFARAVRVRGQTRLYRMRGLDLLLAAAANLAKDEFDTDPSRLRELMLLVDHCRGDEDEIWREATQWGVVSALTASLLWAKGFGEGGEIPLLRTSPLHPVHRQALTLAFDFNAAHPLSLRTRRRRQAVGLPLLSDTLLRAASALPAFVVANGVDAFQRVRWPR